MGCCARAHRDGVDPPVAYTYVLIRSVARLPPGEPGHRCPGLLRRSAQPDAAAEGDAQPLQKRLERDAEVDSCRTHQNSLLHW